MLDEALRAKGLDASSSSAPPFGLEVFDSVRRSSERAAVSLALRQAWLKGRW